jgi:tRNA-specific 2-thiouridylase
MRALALFSGGLDSMLAMKLISDQGVDVIALHVNFGFGSRTDNSEVLRQRAKQAGASLEIVDVKERYLKEVLFNPKYGYGKNFNPCVDCHGFMFRLALELLPKYDANFIITGEVVGQRPMSQRPSALKAVQNLANDENRLIVRPLCAKHLEITLPEEKGWIDREKLLDISGRSREVQMQLASKYQFEDYASPGGGCLLTLKSFSNRIKDVLAHDSFDVEDTDLLKHGRHLRLPGGAKLVIGRDEADNLALEKLKLTKYNLIKLHNVVGPVGYLHVNASEEDTKLAIKLMLAYAKTQKENTYQVSIAKRVFEEKPLPSKQNAQEYLVR